MLLHEALRRKAACRGADHEGQGGVSLSTVDGALGQEVGVCRVAETWEDGMRGAGHGGGEILNVLLALLIMTTQ